MPGNSLSEEFIAVRKILYQILTQKAQNPLCHLLNELDIQSFQGVRRLVVMRIAEKSRVGDHDCGNIVVPEW